MGQYEEWSRRLRASDPKACRELFDALRQPLLRYAAHITGDDDAAYDVVQNAFIQIWKRRRALDPQHSLKSYLFATVRHQALNHMRTRERERKKVAAIREQSAKSAPQINHQIDIEMLATLLNNWIEELPERCREAFRLSRYHHLTHKEIAEVMDIAPRTVTNHVMTALDHLRHRYETFQRRDQPHNPSS